MSDHGESLLLTPGDVDIAMRTVWMEARGEPFEGMVAVMHTIINRVIYREQDKWNTVAQVCLAWLQFSGWREADPNFAAAMELSVNHYQARRASLAVWTALLEADTTSGARHYHAVSIEPYWAKGHEPVLVIAKHCFYNTVA